MPPAGPALAQYPLPLPYRRRATVWAHLLASWEDPAARYRLYLGFTLFLYVLAHVAVSFKEHFTFVVGDGRGYYVYLPSLVIDSDLDFSNQIREHWDKDFDPSFVENVGPRGLVKNRYTIAFALTLAPAFLLSHALSHLVFELSSDPLFVPDGYSVLYQVFNLAFIMGLGLISLILTDRILTERFKLSPLAIVLGIGLACLGSPYIYYFFREPFMVHMASAFWATLSLWCLHRVTQSPTAAHAAWIRYGCLFFATGMAVLIRPTNIWLAPFFIYLLLVSYRASRLKTFMLASILGIIPVLPQLGCWHRMSGDWIYYSYESEGFDWLQPALWKTLFSSRHGLFFWSPILLGAALGFRLAWKKQGKPDPFVVCSIGGFCILWYFNSAWRDWWFGDAFGGRAFVELFCVFAIGLAYLAQAALERSKRTQILFATAMGIGLFYHFALMLAYIVRLIPRNAALF